MKQIKIDTNILKQLNAIISRFSSYKQFSQSKKDCYQYTMLIGVKVCPYCNINYIPTIFDVTRPELDHFLAQSSDDGKKKTLDPHNLVPSCHTCNSTLKGKKKFTQKTHIHPFFDDFDEIMRFSINMTGSNIFDCNDFEIVLTPISNDMDAIERARMNIKDFKLIERYANHKESVTEHLHLISHYGKRKSKEVFELLEYKNIECHHLNALLAKHMNPNINSTTLGKMIKDIYNTYLIKI